MSTNTQPAWKQAYDEWEREPPLKRATGAECDAFHAGYQAADHDWVTAEMALLPARRAAPQLLEACKAMAEAKRLSRGLTNPDDIEMAKQAYAAAMVKIEKALIAAGVKP